MRWKHLILVLILSVSPAGAADQEPPSEARDPAAIEAASKDPLQAPPQPEADWLITDIQSLKAGATALPPSGLLPYIPTVNLRTTSVLAVGDVIPHGPVVESAVIAPQQGSKSKGKTWDFKPMYAAVKDRISAADTAIVNLETPLAGVERGITGFPMFNAPDPFGDALLDAGFDIATTANNHCMDRSESGLRTTLATLDNLGLAHAGTATDEHSQHKRSWFETEVGRAVLLSYTFSTNGIPLPKDKDWLVNYPIDEQAVIADITAVRAQGADLVLLALHWGEEYSDHPTREQKRLAHVFAIAGADAVLGGHPHVLQPAEYLRLEKPGEAVRHSLIIYSMGNFLSNQRTWPRDLGLMVEASWFRIDGLNPQLHTVNLSPIWVDSRDTEGRRYRILELTDALQACKDNTDKDLDALDCSHLRKLDNEAGRVLK